METREAEENRVVVTGVGIVCALGKNKFQVLSGMLANRTGIGPIRSFDTAKFRCHIGGEVTGFDPASFLSGREKDLDRCAQLAVVAASEALAEAGLDSFGGATKPIGVALGTCNGGILSLENQRTIDPERMDPRRTARYPFYAQAEALAAHFGLSGPVVTTNTACAASGNAIGFAYDLVRRGHIPAMLAGGADAMSLLVYAGFNALQALNPEPCSPYSMGFGLSLGEGAGVLVLESLASALARGVKIYAEVRGYGLSNDAHHATAPEPSGSGICFATELALRRAGLSAGDVDYVNTHGTGTQANDAAELRGLALALGKGKLARTPISSSKAYFGHTLGAAAAIEYISTLLPMEEGLLPATLHFRGSREGCDGAEIIANQMRSAGARVFLCNNSAFGGHNASLASRRWTMADAERACAAAPPRRVAVVGTGVVAGALVHRGSLLDRLALLGATGGACSFDLREHKKELYERRMNRLSQMALGAADQAILDAGLALGGEDRYDVGLVFGTARGSLEAAEKYIGEVLERGPEHVSSIHFPDMVLNSTAGRLAKKFRIKGFGSSLSTGGHDGLAATLFGFESVRDEVARLCLVGAGDEFSGLASAIDRAEALDAGRRRLAEGSAFLVLSELEHARATGLRIRAELLGFGMSFAPAAGGQRAAARAAAEVALAQARLRSEDIDVCLATTPARGAESATVEGCVPAPLLSFDRVLGYAPSTSSLLCLALAADLVGRCAPIPDEVLALADASAAPTGAPRRALVIAKAIGGSYAAAVIAGGDR